MDLKKQKKEIVLVLIAVALLTLIAQQINITGFAVAGSITSQRLVWANGSTATLVYDDNTSTYTDLSLENNNMYVEICSNNVSTDLLNQYIKLVYRVSTSEVDLTVLPAQITSSDINGSCATIDLDTNLFSAYYPGIVTIALDSSPSFPSPTYYPLTQATGFLSGNYTTKYEQVGGSLVYSVYQVFDDQGNNITTSLPYMVLGIYNQTGLVNVSIVSPGQNVTIPYPGDNFSFVVNSFNVSLAYDVNAPEDCTNNIDDNANGLIDCDDPDCANHPACLAPTPSGGGAGRSTCQRKWVCSPWGNCQPDGIQTRVCYDASKCDERRGVLFSTNGKPNETQSCEYVPQCDDNVLNQDETDVDCGGDICAKCPLNKRCQRDSDCMSDNCLSGICRPYGIECYEDSDCPRTYICQENKCIFTGVIRMPVPSEVITTAELFIVFVLLAITLISSSFYAYQKYLKTGLYQKREKQKFAQTLTQFVTQAQEQGYSQKTIKKALRDKGWPSKTINQYFKQLPKEPKNVPSQNKLRNEVEYYKQQLKNLKK